MSEACNATLNTVDRRPCFHDDEYPSSHDRECVWHDNRWWNITLHTLTCDGGSTCFTDLVFGRNWHESGGTGTWFDDTPGATPHTPVSTVIDDEWVRALRAVNAPEDIIERAARRVRAAQEDDR